MVRLWKRDDKLVRPLVTGENTDAGFLQSLGAHQSDQLEEQIRLLLEELRRCGLHRGFELFVVCSGNSVPSLGFPPVHIVDAERLADLRKCPVIGVSHQRVCDLPIRIVVFLVPSESGKDHPDIYPRHSHARNVGLDVPEKRSVHDRQVVEVPAITRVGLHGVGLEGRKAAVEEDILDHPHSNRVRKRKVSHLPYLVACMSAPYSTSTVSS